MKWGPQLIAICTSCLVYGFMVMKDSSPGEICWDGSASETLVGVNHSNARL